MAKEFIKRKNYVIDKNFQFKFIATFLVIIVISLALFSACFALYYWVRYLSADNVFKELITIHSQEYVTEDGKILLDDYGNKVTNSVDKPGYNRIDFVLPPVLINNLIIMVFISIIGIYYSHKIAGPVYRIETDITRILEGEQGVRIRLRKNDKLTTLADKINDLLDKLEKKA